MKRIWNKIKEIGLDETVETADRKYITLINILSFLTSLLIIGYIPFILHFLPESKIFLYLTLPLVPLNLFVLILNKFKKYLIAKIFFSISGIFTFIAISLLAGYEVNFHLYLILIIFGSFFTYSYKERTFRYVIILLALLSFFGLESWFFMYDGIILLPSHMVRVMTIIFNTGLIFFVLGFSFYISTIYMWYEKQLLEKQEIIKKSQAKLVQAEKLAALGRLTADIAHEIRNPLTALGGFGRRLQKTTSSLKEKKYADIIVSEADRLEHILRDVLTFSREVRFHFERMPITEVIDSSIKTFTEMCNEHSIMVKVNFSTDLTVLIDAGQVRQAVNNLILNAIDAMPEGGSITINTVEKEANNVTYLAVHISDTGLGIPEEELPLIFEPFHTTKAVGNGTGTGLGLSITRKIIEEHGGFITAENNADKGITVSLYFPYQSEEEQAKISCWRYMKCGREFDSEEKCPAYPNYGRICWVVAGSFYEGKIFGTFAQKFEDCRKCDFYKMLCRKDI